MAFSIERSLEPPREAARTAEAPPVRDGALTPGRLRPSPRAGLPPTDVAQDLAARPDSYSLTRPDRPETLRTYHVAMLARAPMRAPITEGPLRGPRPRVGGGLDFGHVAVLGEDAGAYETARAYAERDPETRSMLLHLEDGAPYGRDLLTGRYAPRGAPVGTAVRTTRDPAVPSTHAGDVVTWNVRQGAACAQGVTSPALGLAHEMTHRYGCAIDPRAHVARAITPWPRYANREERMAIAHERRLAARVGEPERRRIDGRAVRVGGVTEREPLDPPSRPEPPLDLETTRARRRALDARRLAACRAMGPGWIAYGRRPLRPLDAPAMASDETSGAIARAQDASDVR